MWSRPSRGGRGHAELGSLDEQRLEAADIGPAPGGPGLTVGLGTGPEVLGRAGHQLGLVTGQLPGR